MEKLETKIPPPLLVLLIAPAMWAATFVQAPLPVEGRLHIVLQIAIGAFALTFGFSGITAFRRARTTINPVQIDQASRLVNGGIYRLSRNPMYVGLTGLLMLFLSTALVGEYLSK